MYFSKVTTITLLLPVLLFAGCSSDQSGEAEEKDSADQTTEQTDAGSTTAQKKLDEAVEAYRQYGLSQTDTFVEDTSKFVDAVKAGNLEKAKQLYPKARMPYERIEPIAEALGDLDPKIDAREGDVPKDEWTGYHKIEKILWEDNTTDGAEKYAEQLLNDVKSLRAKIELAEVSPQTLVTGSVDLLNEVSSSKITGEEERYSHTDLYDFAANVDGSKKIVELLNPVIKEKDEELASTLEKRFDEVYEALNQYKKGDGYVSYTDLSDKDTQKLSKSIDALAEPLSQIGIVLEK
ncbi:EfeM/EfeO family lipoprotein [Halobacillus salinarum]|uniref:EfeM/EfeO family lipoprotein n=1 Tax=Halobacillus salinarum TaxID=2932257 RepID=A0ABY4EH58_9BACI|nr:iron uptake system protein EfeO [Halobacillus salinarum]UOQ43809.1 EfeM/EfeO family lipoprotein [Halobacillus salinarum]